MKFELTKVEPYNGRYIRIIARRVDNKERVIINVKDFYPYFYVRSEDVEKALEMKEERDDVVKVIDGFYTKMDDEDLAKVVLSHPNATGNVRSEFEEHWESDVRYKYRFKFDTNLQSVFRIPDKLLNPQGPKEFTTISTAIQPLHENENATIPKRNLWYDIEVSNEDGQPIVEDAQSSIVSITAFDSYKDKLISWVWREDLDNKIENKIYSFEVNKERIDLPSDDLEDDYVDKQIYNWEVRKFDFEVKMLTNFIEYVKNAGIDILSGWYSDKFDTPYVLRRMDNIGMNPNDWSPVGYTDDGINPDSDYDNQCSIDGIWMNDLLRRYDKLVGASNKSLESVAEKEVGMFWEQYSGDVDEVWEDDLSTLLQYNANDVVATMLVDQEQEVTQFYIEKYYMSGTEIEDIERAIPVIDSYHFYNCEKDEILPRKTGEESDFGGGIVFEPTPGVNGPIKVLDLSKIYPYIMISLNLSYENYIGRDYPRIYEDIDFVDDEGDTYSFEEGEKINPSDLNRYGRKSLWNILYDLQSDGSLEKNVEWEFLTQDELGGKRLPNGIRVREDRSGLTPRVLEDMFELRFKYEDRMEMLDESSPDYNSKYNKLDRKKSVMKQDVNGVYGAMGYDKFRLNKPPISEAVTFVGRNILKFSKVVVKDMGYNVAYGDTDSTMVLSNTDDIEVAVDQGMEIEKEINDRLDKFGRNFCDISPDQHKFEMELEKIYESMFFGTQKKRYAGKMCWHEDGGMLEEPKLDINGFEYVRGDSPQITKDLQKKFFNSLLMNPDKGKQEIIDEIEEIYTDVLNGDVDVIDATRGPSISGWDKDSIHVKAAKYMKSLLDAEVKKGDNVHYVYVKESQMGYTEEGNKLPPQPTGSQVVGINKDIDPPYSMLRCRKCDNQELVRSFVGDVERYCPECASSSVEVDGCAIDWDTLAQKFVLKKARKVLEHLGWEDELETLGNQTGMDAFV